MSNEDNFALNDFKINYKSISCDNIPELFLDKLTAKKYFGKFGKIYRFILRPMRLQCTVEYEREEDAENAFANAGDFNGHNFDVKYSTNEIAHTHNTEEWVDPDVQAELEAMGGSIRSSTRLTSVKYNAMKPSKSNLKSKDGIQRTDIGTRNEIEAILRKQAVTVEDRYQILDARDKLIRLLVIRTTDIKKVVSIKGICPDMCPEKERMLREAKQQISIFEMEDGNRNTMNHKIAIKEYSRSSADQETPLAHELRPEPVLKMTMNYLMHKIMNLCDDPNANIGDWYHFVWDRTRSIRKDITQQELCSLDAVQLVEQCARFHIHCAARLVAEDPSAFDQKINTENLTKCLQTLKYMYHDLRLKDVKCRNEAEFRAYIILLNLNDANFLWEVKQLPLEIQNSSEVRTALKIHIAMESNNYVSFFKLVRSTTYMNACILLRYFNQIRLKALKTIIKAYNSPRQSIALPLKYFKEILAFESEDAAISLFTYYGLECNSKDVYLDRNVFTVPDLPYTMDRALILVEGKRTTSVGEAVCGQTLDSLAIFENYIPHNSFDNEGYLKPEAWTAEDQIPRGTSFDKPFKESGNNLFKVPMTSPLTSPKLQQQKSIFSSKPSYEGSINISIEPAPPVFSTRQAEETNSENLFKFTKKVEDTNVETTTGNVGFFTSALSKFSQPTNAFFQSRANIFTNEIPISNSVHGNIFNKFAKPSEYSLNQNHHNLTPKQSINFPISSSLLNKGNSSEGITFDNGFKEKNMDFGRGGQMQQYNQKMVEDKQRIQAERLEIKDNKQEKERWEIKGEQSEKEEKLKKMEKQDFKRVKEEKGGKNEHTKLEKLKVDGQQLKLEQSKEPEAISIEKNAQNILNDLLINIDSEIREICLEEVNQYKEICRSAEEIANKIIKEYVLETVSEIIEEESLILSKKQQILKSYFSKWVENVRRKKERRRLIECTPMWLMDESIEKHALELSPPKQQETLMLMTRYRLGLPENFELSTSKEEPIDLFNLINNVFKLDMNINNQGIIKSSRYLKIILSLPQDYDESHGFYSYMNKWLEDSFKRAKNKSEEVFFCESHANMSLCIRKISGIIPKNEKLKKVTTECDHSDAMLFVMTAADIQNSRFRLHHILKLSRIFKKIPLAIIIYNNSLQRDAIEDELEINKLFEEGHISEFIILGKNYCVKEKNLRKTFKEAFKYLALKYEHDCDLEMQQMIPFLKTTVGDEFWRRIHESWMINPSMRKICTQPNKIIYLFNQAIDRLIALVDENFDEFPEFPEELRQFVPKSTLDIPLDVEYFPKDWKIEERRFRIKDFLTKVKLKSFGVVPQEIHKLEKALLDYSHSCIPVDEHTANKAGYKAIRSLLEKLNSPDLLDLPISQKMLLISWLDIMKSISLEMLSHVWNTESKYLPNEIIYKRSIYREYTVTAWWLDDISLKEIKMLQRVDESLALPKAKRLKTDIGVFELESILNKGSALVEKADENIEKIKKFSSTTYEVSREFDMALYKQEMAIRNAKRLIRERL